MSQLLEIPRSMIVVRAEDNPRSAIVEDDVANLEKSIRQNGLVSALTVEPIEADGQVTGYKLAAGYTRIAALDALHQGDGTDFLVPCIVKDPGTADLTAIIENVVRTDLPPVDEALRYEQLIDKGMTDVGIANQVGIPLQRVRARLEILKLHQQAILWISQGKLPVSAVKPLLKIQAHHEGLALECARYCKGAPHLGQLLAKRPHDVVKAVAEQKTKPFWPYPLNLRTSEVRTFLEAGQGLAEQEVKDLLSRMAAFDTPHYEATWGLAGQQDYDTLRGNGALIPTEKQQPYGVIYDPAPALPLFVREVADKEQFRAAQAKANAERKLREGKTTVDPNADSSTQEAQKQAAAAARKQAVELAKECRGHNLTLGTGMIVDEPGALRMSNADAVRLICLELISALQLGKVARAGLRLVLSQLQEETTVPGKNGAPPKQKVTYLQNIGDCEEAARKWIEGADTTEELFHRTVCLLLAAEGSLQEAVAMSSRQRPGLASGTAQELRRALVEPYLKGGPHETRVKNQWAALDQNTSTWEFPEVAVPDETPEAGQPDVPPVQP